MYFSGYGPETNRGLVTAGRFELVHDEIVVMEEPGGPAAFQWLLARAVGQ